MVYAFLALDQARPAFGGYFGFTFRPLPWLTIGACRTGARHSKLAIATEKFANFSSRRQKIDALRYDLRGNVIGGLLIQQESDS